MLLTVKVEIVEGRMPKLAGNMYIPGRGGVGYGIIHEGGFRPEEFDRVADELSKMYNLKQISKKIISDDEVEYRLK